MAYKKDGDEGDKKTTKGGIFDLNHKLFESTVDPKKGDILGTSYNLLDANGYNTDFSNNTKFTQQEWQLPGLMSIAFMPTFGVASKKSDPINLAATSLFKKIQNALKKTNLKYQSSDVMMQLGAHDSLFMMYNYIKRGYEALNYYNPWNKYTAQDLFMAMGLDYDDFLSNSAQISYDLTVWANTLKSFPIPSHFQMFSMHSAMLSQVFTDVEEADKSQVYVFNPSYVWQYPTFEGTKPATYRLTPIPVYQEGYGRPYGQVKRIFTDLLNAMITSSDFQEINSNLLSTFETGEFYTVTAPGLTDVLTVSYDVNVIEALMNARIVPISGAAVATTWGPECTSDNVIRIGPNINNMSFVEAMSIGAATVVNATSDTIDNKRLARCLRWHPVFQNIGYVQGSNHAATGYSVATEILTGITLWVRDPGGAVGRNRYDFYSNAITEFYDGTDDNVAGPFIAASIDAFRYHPTFYVAITRTVDEVEKVFMRPMAQWHYAVSVDREDIANIDNAYLWQAFLGGLEQ